MADINSINSKSRQAEENSAVINANEQDVGADQGSVGEGMRRAVSSLSFSSQRSERTLNLDSRVSRIQSPPAPLLGPVIQAVTNRLRPNFQQHQLFLLDDPFFFEENPFFLPPPALGQNQPFDNNFRDKGSF